MASTRHAGQFAAIVEEWRVHWRQGLASFVGMGLGGAISPAIFSLFVLPLESNFGWSRSDITLAYSFTVISGLCALFVGRLIDLKGARLLILIGFALMTLLYLALASLPGNLALFYAAYTLLNLFALPTTGLGFARVLCASFVKSRGFSLAVGRAGTSFTAMVLPPLLFAVIAATSWRMGFVTMAVLTACIAFPVSWWGIERRRAGEAPPVAQANEPRPMRQLLRNRHVLTIALGSALAYAAIIGISTQAQPILVDRGLGAGHAANLVGLLGAASLVGAFGTGFLLDRFWAPGVALVMLCAGAGGAVILAMFPGDATVLTIAILLVGLTLGAEIDISSFIIARYCGLADYSSAYGIAVVAIATASAAGPAVMGQIYDAQQSYEQALLFCSACFVMSALVYLTLGRYRD